MSKTTKRQPATPKSAGAKGGSAAPTLLACPFCAGAGALKEQHAGHFVVQCTNEYCGVKRKPELSPLAAVTVWNERAKQTNNQYPETR